MLSGDQTPFSVSREIIKNESNLQQAIGASLGDTILWSEKWGVVDYRFVFVILIQLPGGRESHYLSYICTDECFIKLWKACHMRTAPPSQNSLKNSLDKIS